MKVAKIPNLSINILFGSYLKRNPLKEFHVETMYVSLVIDAMLGYATQKVRIFTKIYLRKYMADKIFTISRTNFTVIYSHGGLNSKIASKSRG